MMLLLVTVTTLPQPLAAVMQAAPSEELPCMMHAGVIAVVEASSALPCDDCETHFNACQEARCGCCYHAVLAMLTATTHALGGATPLLVQARYSSVILPLDSPPPRLTITD
jgi:hypothetical protein